MPKGKGTYGSKRGRPPSTRKKRKSSLAKTLKKIRGKRKRKRKSRV